VIMPNPMMLDACFCSLNFAFIWAQKNFLGPRKVLASESCLYFLIERFIRQVVIILILFSSPQVYLTVSSFVCCVRQRVLHMQVYERVLPDAFAALLDMSPDIEQPMVYFLCLARPEDKLSITFSDSKHALVPAYHIVLDSTVPWKITRMHLSNCSAAAAPRPSRPLVQHPVQPPTGQGPDQQGADAALREAQRHMTQPHMASCQHLQKQLCELYGDIPELADGRRSYDTASDGLVKESRGSDELSDSFEHPLRVCRADKAEDSFPEMNEALSFGRDVLPGGTGTGTAACTANFFEGDIMSVPDITGALSYDALESSSSEDKKQLLDAATDDLMNWL
jgi:hypothetical protein